MFAHLGHVLGGCSQLIGGGFPLPPALSRVTKPCCTFVEGHGAWSEQHLLAASSRGNGPGSKHPKYGFWLSPSCLTFETKPLLKSHLPPENATIPTKSRHKLPKARQIRFGHEDALGGLLGLPPAPSNFPSHLRFLLKMLPSVWAQ